MPKILDELIQELIEEGTKPFERDSTPATAGSSNKVDFGKIGIGRTVARSRRAAKTISPTQSRIYINATKRFHQVQMLFRMKNVDTRFLEKFISFSTSGEKISLKSSEGSLQHFLDKNSGTLTDKIIKNIFGQIVLGIAALHNNDLVHRDLKSANILVDQYKNDKLHIVVSDTEDVANVDRYGRLVDDVDIVASIRPPELQQLRILDRKGWIPEADKHYRLLDLKAIDCYVLGDILEDLLDAREPYLSDEEEDNSELEKLAQALLQENPEDRLTINGVLSHKAFTNAVAIEEKKEDELKEQELSEFFKKLQANSQETYVHGYLAQAVIPDDKFILLSPSVKLVYSLCIQLNRQLDYFTDFYEGSHPTLKKAGDRYKSDVVALVETQEKLDALVKTSQFKESQK